MYSNRVRVQCSDTASTNWSRSISAQSTTLAYETTVNQNVIRYSLLSTVVTQLQPTYSLIVSDVND